MAGSMFSILDFVDGNPPEIANESFKYPQFARHHAKSPVADLSPPKSRSPPPADSPRNEPQTPQSHQLPRWQSPSLDCSTSSISDSPASPEGPYTPISPVMPGLDGAFPTPCPLRLPSRQGSVRRTGSVRRNTPTRIGDLTLGKLIGQGTFCQTFQAFNTTHMYAVKIRLPSTNAELFQHEREILQRLHSAPASAGSECVVQFYPELSTQPNCSVFALYDTSLDELVRSPQYQVDPNSLDFFDFRIISQPVVGLSQWVQWAGQLRCGLAFIHECGIVHADLKPDNVLVSQSRGQLVIADFSSAIDRTQPASTALAQNLAAGLAWSPVYTDPQIRQQQSLPSEGSDIYALGLVLAFMATSCEPYSMAKNPTQRLLWMDRIKPLDSFDPDVMPRLSKVRSVINKCLSRSLAEFDSALAAIA